MTHIFTAAEIGAGAALNDLRHIVIRNEAFAQSRIEYVMQLIIFSKEGLLGVTHSSCKGMLFFYPFCLLAGIAHPSCILR